MLCAVIGQRYIWFFNALNKTEGRKIANIILFFEKLGANTVLSGFCLEKGLWEAVPRNLTEEVKELIEKVDKSKIIEIKKKRPPMIDALYLTRLQKERWPSQDSQD